MSRYPSDAELRFIRKFDLTKKPVKELLDFLQEIWAYSEWGFRLTGKKVLTLKISTAGWSGNEEIIDALKQNPLFFALYWQEERRGGHYLFKIKPMELKKLWKSKKSSRHSMQSSHTD